MPTGGIALVEGLEKSGVRFVFGIPAVHNLPVYDALYEKKTPRTITVRHEQAAGFMAIGSAYASGRPATAVVGCGPGATNVITPVAEAYLDSSPMLVVAGGLRTTSTGKGALHDVDQLSMFLPVTKLASRCLDASRLEHDASAAVQASATGRPRPVFLEVPFDVLSKEIPAGASLPTPVARTPPSIPEDALSLSSRALSNSVRPLIVVGGGINSAEAWNELRNVADRLGSPVASTISAKGAYSERLPLSVGQLWDDVARRAAEEADVVLALGCRFSERSTASWGLRFSGSIIQVDLDPNELGRNYPVSLGVTADAREFLRRLLPTLSARSGPEKEGWVEGVRKARALRKVALDKYALEDRSRVRPHQVVREVAASVPEDTIFVAETGHAFWWAALTMEVERPRSFLSPSGNSTLGFGFPAALGVKCTEPSRPVVCLVGDGGFMFSCQEIATSVEEKIPVVIVVFDDGGYAAIREYQKKGYGSRYVGVDFGVRADFVKLADSLGAVGVPIESLHEVGPAVKEACRSSRTTVIDVKIGKDENVLPKFFTDIYRRK